MPCNSPVCRAARLLPLLLAVVELRYLIFHAGRTLGSLAAVVGAGVQGGSAATVVTLIATIAALALLRRASRGLLVAVLAAVLAATILGPGHLEPSRTAFAAGGSLWLPTLLCLGLLSALCALALGWLRGEPGSLWWCRPSGVESIRARGSARIAAARRPPLLADWSSRGPPAFAR